MAENRKPKKTAKSKARPKPKAEPAPVNIEPWERREDEGEEAFEAFQIYRDLGFERSQIRVSDTVGKDPSLIARWSSAYGWVGRVLAYDRHVDMVRREAQEKEIRDMLARHADAARVLQAAAIEDLSKLRQLQKDAKDKGRKGPTLSPELVLRFIDVGSKLERLSRGEPESTSRVQLDDPLTMGLVTDEGVRDAARDLVERAARARSSQPSRSGASDES